MFLKITKKKLMKNDNNNNLHRAINKNITKFHNIFFLYKFNKTVFSATFT